MKKKYKGIDLFCGIGGFRLAMNSSQVECVFSSDNDKFAQQTYEANFHEVPTGDIKAVDEKDIPKFDILTLMSSRAWTAFSPVPKVLYRC